eukprot:Nk52_evm1s293 gene=Nk52_evmTU1s293
MVVPIEEEEEKNHAVSGKVLSNILPVLYEHRWYLNEYVAEVFGKGNVLSCGEKDYVKFSKSTIICSSAAACKSSVEIVAQDRFFSQSEIIDRAIEILLNANAKMGFDKDENLLTLGFRKRNSNSSNGMKRLMNVECYFPNTLLKNLKGVLWNVLLNDIGDTAMLNLLLKTSIFLSLPNGNYFQVCGPPAFSLVNNMIQMKKLPPFPAHVHKGAKEKKEKRKKKTKKKRKWEGENDSHSAKRMKLDMENVEVKEVKEEEEEVIKTQPKNQPNSSEGQLLPRTAILYSNNHSEKLGEKFVLNLLPSTTEGARSLVRTVFNLKPSKGKTQKCNRLPKRFVSIVPHFKKILKNGKSCPYRKLLDYYCPVQKNTKGELAYLADLLHIQRQQSEKTFSPEKDNFNSQEEEDNFNSQEEDYGEEEKEYISGSDEKEERDLSSNLSSNISSASDCVKKLYKDLIEKHCTYYQVFGFLKSVVKKVIPSELFGSQHNIKKFHSNLKSFIKLRRYERPAADHFVKGFRINDCPWLGKKSTKTDYVYRKQMFEAFMFWIFNNFLVPVIRAYLYVTENGAQRNRVYYYRMHVWNRVTGLSFREHCGSMFNEIAYENLAKILGEKNRPFGYSLLRFLPKASSVRPIVNMGRKPSEKEKGLLTGANVYDGKRVKGLSINHSLQSVLNVLTFEKQRKTSYLGFSVFGPDDIYSRMSDFCFRNEKRLEQLRQHAPSCKKIYTVSIDFSKAFDLVDQQKLVEIIKPLLEEDEYVIKRFCRILSSLGRVKKEFKKHVCTTYDFEQFDTFAERLSAEKLHNTVLCDQVIYHYHPKVKLIGLLEEHIFKNIIQFKDKYYIQKQGIPQGSLLSTLLCSYFYGDMEKNIVKMLKEEFGSDNGDQFLGMRLVDDFIFFSWSKEIVLRTLKCVTDIAKDYSVLINWAKSLVNFVDPSIEGSKMTQVDCIPWCGMMLDLENFGIYADYTRYINQHIDQALTIDWSKNPGNVLYFKMVQFLKPKTGPVYMDMTINTRYSVGVNVFQVFLLCAMKFHCYISSLPKAVFNPLQNKDFVTRVVLGAIEALPPIIASRMRIAAELQRRKKNINMLKPASIGGMVGMAVSKTSRVDMCLCSKSGLRFNDLSIEEVRLYGLLAFSNILERKQTRYPMLLKCFKKEILSVVAKLESPNFRARCISCKRSLFPERLWPNSVPEWKEVAGCSQHKVFENIQF